MLKLVSISGQKQQVLRISETSKKSCLGGELFKEQFDNSHFFHFDCLRAWFGQNKKCPVCFTLFEQDLTAEMVQETLKFFSCPELELL